MAEPRHVKRPPDLPQSWLCYRQVEENLPGTDTARSTLRHLHRHKCGSPAGLAFGTSTSEDQRLAI